MRLSEKRFVRSCEEEPAESPNLLISAKLILKKLVINLATGTGLVLFTVCNHTFFFNIKPLDIVNNFRTVI